MVCGAVAGLFEGESNKSIGRTEAIRGTEEIKNGYRLQSRDVLLHGFRPP